MYEKKFSLDDPHPAIKNKKRFFLFIGGGFALYVFIQLLMHHDMDLIKGLLGFMCVLILIPVFFFAGPVLLLLGLSPYLITGWFVGKKVAEKYKKED